MRSSMKKAAALALSACLLVGSAQAVKASDFSDLKSNHWAYSYIDKAAGDGLVSGMGNGKFGPEEKLSNAQFITMVCNLLYEDNVKSFPSGSGANWWLPYLNAAQSVGILNNTTIASERSAAGAWTAKMANAEINRYDMAQIMMNVAKEEDWTPATSSQISTAQSQIADWSSIPSKYQNAVASAYALKYVKFDLPSSSQGTLYYGYGSTQQTRVSSSAKYQTTTHLDFISFMPNAGFSGTATISYTGFDMNENFYYGTITVTVTPPTRSSYFVDASESWIAPAADFLYNGGVYTGVVAGNTLGVRDKTTRGEVMQMIYNAFNLKSQVASVESHFTDVPATHAYYTAINAANQLGIALGDQGKFRPNEAITRQDAMTLLFRAFTKLGITMVGGGAGDLQSFGDFKDVDSYAVEALGTMARSGIIQGDAGMIKPKGDVSRGEVSVMLYRAMTL